MPVLPSDGNALFSSTGVLAGNHLDRHLGGLGPVLYKYKEKIAEAADGEILNPCREGLSHQTSTLNAYVKHGIRSAIIHPMRRGAAMLKRIIIVPLLLATLCTVIALPVSAQVVEGFRLDRQGQRLSTAAKTEEDRNKAEEKFKAALSIFRKFNHPKGEAQVLNDFGILYANRGKYSEALEYYNQALEIKRRIGWPWGAGNTLVNLGSLYKEQGNLSKAAEYYEQAVKAYQRAPHDKAAGNALDLLGKTYKTAPSVSQGHRVLGEVRRTCPQDEELWRCSRRVG